MTFNLKENFYPKMTIQWTSTLWTLKPQLTFYQHEGEQTMTEFWFFSFKVIQTQVAAASSPVSVVCIGLWPLKIVMSRLSIVTKVASSSKTTQDWFHPLRLIIWKSFWGSNEVKASNFFTKKQNIREDLTKTKKYACNRSVREPLNFS